METKFIILCHGRSGSTALQLELDTSPQTYCYGEIYHPGYMKHNPITETNIYAMRNKDPVSYVNYLYSKHQNNKVVGSKILYPEIPLDALKKLISNSGFSFIFLYRRNILEAAISMVLAEKVNLWHISEGVKSPIPESFTLDKPHLEKHINDIVMFITTCKNNIKGRVCDVAYEDLFCLSKFNEIFQFLGIPSKQGLTANTGKQMNEECYNSILNRKEIEEQYGPMYGYLGRNDTDIGFWRTM